LNKSIDNPVSNSMNNSINNSIKSLSGSLTINSVGMEFILISAGEFNMGSPMREKRRKLWESPVHKVTIKEPFYLGRYPVTQEQWHKVMGNNPA
ncbi:MAG TPA: SUMF1/EgtB/PvdO family nonheme iron enzyme, partial [Methanosarcina sp.]|nr:SUMF1/EgtB/PvdO family nonheme iron enzyme [Methanosarcina sp.]